MLDGQEAFLTPIREQSVLKEGQSLKRGPGTARKGTSSFVFPVDN
jgi:hypothetical protein